ncbi:MAG: VOC family protein [Pseudomonadota bacterium]
MTIKYAHTNLVARDWRNLSLFYRTVFECVPVPPQRRLSGSWLGEAIGVPGASLEGEHLRLPGFGDEGPTLEIFSYAAMEDRPAPRADRLGLCHLAFQVDDVAGVLTAVEAAGGRAVGRVTAAQVAGKGLLTFVYAADPEGNIVEIQSWT